MNAKNVIMVTMFLGWRRSRRARLTRLRDGGSGPFDEKTSAAILVSAYSTGSPSSGFEINRWQSDSERERLYLP